MDPYSYFMDYRLKDYFAFTKRERVGLVVLLMTISFIIALPWMLPRRPSVPLNYARAQQIQDRLDGLKGSVDSSRRFRPNKLAYRQQATYHQSGYLNTDGDDRMSGTPRENITGERNPSPENFPFDPNTLPENDWKKLGVSGRVARTVRNYIAKGGRFRTADDLGKIYGLPRDVLHRLLPYVKIPASTEERKACFKIAHSNVDPYVVHNASGSGLSGSETVPVSSPPKKRTINNIDINNSDTTAWIALPGIGSKLANRIIRYRESLGGFHSIEQIAEIYGLRDSTFQQLRPFLQCTAPTVRKININTAEAEDLKQHPYVRWQLASLIIQYRKQHGSYHVPEDLGQLALVTPDLLKKLLPYITTDDPSGK